jgi:ABC-type transporter Mla subunit MlaD
MNAETDWLAILEKSSSYADLATAFSAMSAAVHASVNSDALVDSIDEAIRRIEQERMRDQSELAEVSASYDTFKQEQSGVIGWFKRKLPFTETRKQELEHRHNVSDQMAEILADNFVIARAQMLKERIATPSRRRMGQQIEVWRQQLLQNESTESIREYGRIVYGMGQELSSSKSFLDTISSDIEAFASANFSEKQDQLRRNADLAAAKGERQRLQEEVKDKSELRKASIATIKKLLLCDLSANDDEFRANHQRLAQLDALQNKQSELWHLLQEQSKVIKEFVAKALELDAIPDRRAKVERAILDLNRDIDKAESERVRAASGLETPRELYETARREADQASAAFKAAKPLYDAYLAEQSKLQSNAAEVSSDADFEINVSNVVTEYQRLEAASRQAIQTLNQRTPEYEQAKRRFDAAVKAVQELRSSLENQLMEQKKMVNLESETQEFLRKFWHRFDSMRPNLKTMVKSYIEEVRKSEAVPNSGGAERCLHELIQDTEQEILPPSLWPGDRSFSNQASYKDTREIQRVSELLEKASKALDAERTTHSQLRTKLARIRKEALQRRSQMLFDESVYSELNWDDAESR